MLEALALEQARGDRRPVAARAVHDDRAVARQLVEPLGEAPERDVDASLDRRPRSRSSSVRTSSDERRVGLRELLGERRGGDPLGPLDQVRAGRRARASRPRGSRRRCRSRSGRAECAASSSRPGSTTITIGSSWSSSVPDPGRVAPVEADVDAAAKVGALEVDARTARRAAARRRPTSSSTSSSESGVSPSASASSSVGRSFAFSTAS